MKKSVTVVFEQVLVGGEIKMSIVPNEGVQGPSEALRMLHRAMTVLFSDEEKFQEMARNGKRVQVKQ